ncbi:MAG: UDP-glucose/GDP-mannose dehydrogenase family protein [Candidatus Eremiobacterota bacterium]
MNVVIVGAGYVGLTTGLALAYLGHRVSLVERDEARLALLRARKSPIHEHGLEEFLQVLDLTLCPSAAEAVGEAEVVLIAVGTPAMGNGKADTGFVEEAAREVAQGLKPGGTYTLVVKSTVPLGTNRRVSNVVGRVLKQRQVEVTVHFAANPEFLREALALRDTLYPDRVVVGAEHPQAVDALRLLYQPILEQTFEPPAFLPRPEGFRLPPLITTDATSAEMIKYAANAFLAAKISFINEVAGLCERVGADVTEVARGIGLDPRIGHRLLGAGIGWGGSCFPKDTAAILAVAAEYGEPMTLISAAREVNFAQRRRAVDRLQATLKVLRGQVIAVLGLAFKPDTDDVRESPALDIIRLLIERGAHVRAHDPVAIPAAQRALAIQEVEFLSSPYAAAEGTDALVIATDWEEYRRLDLERLAAGMRQPILLDGRNLIKPYDARLAGFTYLGIGR